MAGKDVGPLQKKMPFSRVADPVGINPDPTFPGPDPTFGKKRQDPTFKKTPDTGPTFEKNPNPDLTLEKNRIRIRIRGLQKWNKLDPVSLW